MERDKILEDILQYSGMDQASIDRCREATKNSPVYKAKSDSLFRFGVMNGLLFEQFEDCLDIFMIITDANTRENASLVHAAKAKGEEKTFDYSEDTINYIIHDLAVASSGHSRVDNNGNKVGNEVLTILMNTIAKICISSSNMMDNFNDCLKYWRGKLEKDKKVQEI